MNTDGKRPRAPAPGGQHGDRNPGNSRGDIKCFFCGGPHMKRECEKFTKLKNSQAFMALAQTYSPEEIVHLNVLISSTDRPVCRFCLDKNCDGKSCGRISPSLNSAKQNFFSDGSYEQVLSAKQDRPYNRFGHSSFNLDSYLRSQTQAPEGANTTDDLDMEVQEDVCIMKQSDPEENHHDTPLDDSVQDPQVGLNRSHEDPPSDESSVEEDEDPPIASN
jgi:hypothetical protein